ncbi:hypothetical protein MRX96_021262 [Rhipicephalus microplus]
MKTTVCVFVVMLAVTATYGAPGLPVNEDDHGDATAPYWKAKLGWILEQIGKFLQQLGKVAEVLNKAADAIEKGEKFDLF